MQTRNATIPFITTDLRYFHFPSRKRRPEAARRRNGVLTHRQAIGSLICGLPARTQAGPMGRFAGQGRPTAQAVRSGPGDWRRAEYARRKKLPCRRQRATGGLWITRWKGTAVYVASKAPLPFQAVALHRTIMKILASPSGRRSG